jgi:hypothetical protein
MTHSNSSTEPQRPILEFTGKFNILLEVEEYGPIEFFANNKEVAEELFTFILAKVNKDSTVNAQDTKASAIYSNIMEKIK